MSRFDSLFSSFARPALEHQFGELSNVTYITRRTDDGGDAHESENTIEGAIKRPFNLQEQPFGAANPSSTSVTWIIGRDKLDALSITPQRGDIIADSAGTAWTIMGWAEPCQVQYDFQCQKGIV